MTSESKPCTCRDILEADATRHFKECPARAANSRPLFARVERLSLLGVSLRDAKGRFVGIIALDTAEDAEVAERLLRALERPC